MLSVDARYQAAAQELSRRLGIREQVLFSHITLTSALVGVALAREDLRLVALAVPFASLASAFLIAYHDIVVGILSDYMRRLEQYRPNATDIPNFHSDPSQYQSKAHLTGLWLRRLGAQLLYLVFGSLGSLALTSPHTTAVALAPTFWWLGALSAGGTICVLFYTAYRRYRQSILVKS
jgi:hypothetical protein